MKFSKIWYVDASQQKKCYKKTFCISAFFGRFLTKTAKIDQKWRKLAKSKPFDEIFWNSVCICFPIKKMLQTFFFWILAFFGRFLTKNSQNWQSEENWQNPNSFMNFSKIWYVDASQQKKCYKKLFLDFCLFLPFFNQKTAKKKKKIGKT